VRHSGKASTIHRVAVCGGTGISLSPNAARMKADAFVTADIKYHEYFDFPDLLKVDAGHFETEIYIAGHITKRLSDQFRDLKVITSSVRTNPMNIHHSTDHIKSTT
jgi:putative NIF3 family GTP cyclohydrolase 1 type 2